MISLKLATMFYIPTFNNDSLFSIVDFPENFSNKLAFSHALFIKCGLWYAGTGEKCFRCEKASMAYQDENLKVELA